MSNLKIIPHSNDFFNNGHFKNTHFRKGNVEEAIQLHKEAADILRDLLQTVINEKVAESLRLQVRGSKGFEERVQREMIVVIAGRTSRERATCTQQSETSCHQSVQKPGKNSSGNEQRQ